MLEQWHCIRWTMRQSRGARIAQILMIMKGPSYQRRDQRWRHGAQFEPETAQKQMIICLNLQAISKMYTWQRGICRGYIRLESDSTSTL